LQRLAKGLVSNRVRLAQRLPLVALAQQLTACAGFVGHDSGISHLAAALGVPTLALWGETSAAVWRPRGDHVSVVSEAKGLGSLTARRVATELIHWSFHDEVR
jgi:heptosyltransferase-3